MRSLQWRTLKEQIRKYWILLAFMFFILTGFVLDYVMKDDRFLILVVGLNIGALVYSIFRLKSYQYSIFALGSRPQYWRFSLASIGFLIGSNYVIISQGKLWPFLAWANSDILTMFASFLMLFSLVKLLSELKPGQYSKKLIDKILLLIPLVFILGAAPWWLHYTIRLVLGFSYRNLFYSLANLMLVLMGFFYNSFVITSLLESPKGIISGKEAENGNGR